MGVSVCEVESGGRVVVGGVVVGASEAGAGVGGASEAGAGVVGASEAGAEVEVTLGGGAVVPCGACVGASAKVTPICAYACTATPVLDGKPLHTESTRECICAWVCVCLCVFVCVHI